nr:hypothetical protein [Janibacter limosus]
MLDEGLLHDVERGHEPEDVSSVLTAAHLARDIGPSVTNILYVEVDRSAGITLDEEVRMHGVRHEGRVDGQRRGAKRLRQGLPAEDLQLVVVGLAPTEVARADTLVLEER